MTRLQQNIGYDIPAQLELLRLFAPHFYDLVDPRRAQDAAATDPDLYTDDFRSDEGGGRGTSYVRAQRNLEARSRGIRNLTELFARRRDHRPTVVVDLLGGDGLVGQVVENHLKAKDLTFLTCDASPDMVTSAWENGVAALRQTAQHQILRDESVDGVLLAYGSHHVPLEERLQVVREAWRVLRPGGTFVLHDFSVGSPVDTWFSEVVHRYSATGHSFPHFTTPEIEGYLASVGFRDVSVRQLDDSFRTSGTTAAEAKLAMGRYLLNMYGLEKLRTRFGEPACYEKTFDIADITFRYPEQDHSLSRATVSTDSLTGRAEVTVPRRATVGVGRKPADGSRDHD